MKKCLYCKKEIQEDSVMDFCDGCGIKIWGPKMLKAIKDNYGKARDNNDLHGTNSIAPSPKVIK